MRGGVYMSNLAAIVEVFFTIFDKILSKKELYFFSEIWKKGKVGEKMRLQVYLDVIFLVNFAMDYLFFQIINKAVHKNIKRKRILLTAFLGGTTGVLYTCLELKLAGLMVAGWILDLVKLAAAAVFFGILYFLAFGREKRQERLRSTGYFLLVLLLYAGFHLILIRGSHSTCMAIFITGFLFYLFFPVFEAVIGGMKEEIKDFTAVSFNMSGILIKGKGFIDSGNHLREPVSLRPVCIVEKAFMEKFLGEREIEEIFSTKIDYHSLGNPEGKLMAARIKSLQIKNGRKNKEFEDVFLAVYPGSISRDFDFLLNESFRNEGKDYA